MAALRTFTSLGLALALALSHAPAAIGLETLTKADYDNCQSHDERTFRSAIDTITQDALKRSLATFDYKAAVGDAWRTGGMSDIIDKRVDLAVAEVGNETSWGEKLQSLANSQKAQDLAKTVAERVYRSDAIKVGIEGIAADVGKTLGQSFEFASQDASGPAIACVKAFLGNRYGSAVSGAVTTQAEKEFGVGVSQGQAQVSSTSVLAQSSEGITGAAILVVRRSLVNMASRIGQRMVGSVLSRLVSVAAGGVGTVLIAKDIWELRSGVLPIVADEMKSKGTKEQVQFELAKSIADQIGEHIKEVASKSSERIVEIWQEFRRAHVKALELADHNETFRDYLDKTVPSNLPRLDEVVSIVLASEGDGGIVKRLADGTLDTAVNVMPLGGMDIARDTRSMEAGLKWASVADSMLPMVVEQELYKRANPDDFTKVSLARLLALDDKLAIGRLGALKREARETLFELSTGDVKALARALPEPELATLAGYLTGLEKAPRERVMQAIALAPGKMKILASSRVRDAVLASRDQSYAVDMMLRADASGPAQIFNDSRLAFEGQISPVLILERHPTALGLAVIPLLILMLLLRRIFRPRRKTADAGRAL